MLRAVIVGCGKIGSEFADDPRVRGIYTHAGAYAACADTRLVGVCDVDRARAERCAARWGVERAHTGVDALLRDCRPDLVSICSPDDTHAAVLARALDTPGVRGVFAEKPLALDAGEGARLVALAAERGIAIAVNHVRRYAEGHRRVRALVAEGRIGALQAVTGHYTGGVRHNGSHWFDLVRWIVGEVREVEGAVAHGLEGLDAADPTLDVRLECEGGVRATLRAASRDAFSIFELDLLGTAGRVRLTDSGHRIELFESRDSPHYSGYRSLQPAGEWPGGIDDAMLRAVEDLARAVRTGSAPECDGVDGLMALRVGAAAVESARLGRPVAVAPPAVA